MPTGFKEGQPFSPFSQCNVYKAYLKPSQFLSIQESCYRNHRTTLPDIYGLALTSPSRQLSATQAEAALPIATVGMVGLLRRTDPGGETQRSIARHIPTPSQYTVFGVSSFASANVTPLAV